MSSGKISLLSQPANLIAMCDLDFAHIIVDALKQWIVTGHMVTSPRTAQVNMIVGRHAERVRVVEFGKGCMVCYEAISENNLYVCSIEVGSLQPKEGVLRAAAALGSVDHLMPAVTFGPDAAYDEILDVVRLNNWCAPRFFGSPRYSHQNWNVDGMEHFSFDERAGGPAIEPQSSVKEDESRRDESGGLATVRWFAERALSIDGLHLPKPRRSPPLGELPRLP